MGIDRSVGQVLKDSSIMHDLIDEWYEGHEYDRKGNVVDDINATIALHKLEQYIQDLKSEDDNG